MYVFTDEEIKKLRFDVTTLLCLQSQYIIEECLQGRYCSAFKDMREEFEFQEDKFYHFIYEHYVKEISFHDLPFPSCDRGCDHE